MCGRGRCSLPPEQIERQTGVQGHQWRDRDRYSPSYNAAPGFWLPVLRQSAESRILQTMKWGLVPSFTKKGSLLNHYRMFNARSERLRESPVFKRLIHSKRCVVVMNGFYEWHKESSKKKQPYYIHFGEKNITKFAALYDTFENEEEVLYTVSIVTTDASKRLSWLHDRMPVLLPDDKSVELWLSEGTEWKQLGKLLKPYGGDDLMYHPVTEKMGRISFQGKECCLDIRKRGLGHFLSPKYKPKKKRLADDETKEPDEKKIKLEMKTPERKKIKVEVKTETKPWVTGEHKPAKKEALAATDLKLSPERKRMRPLHQTESSPVRKSARLTAKAEKTE